MMLTTIPAKTIMSKIFEFFVMVFPMFFFATSEEFSITHGFQGVKEFKGFNHYFD